MLSEALLYLDPNSSLSLQSQIRQKLVDGIISGAFPPGRRLPSSRKLAEHLGISRNTVVLAYEQLQDEGFLESRERSGIFVREDMLEGRVGYHGPSSDRSEPDTHWQDRIRTDVGKRLRFEFPGDWQQHPYPFIDGQFDASLYPTTQWRESSRMALGARIIREGTVTEGDADDPLLIEEIRTKMLPRRGINARPEEILITLGEQNALYLLTQLLTDQETNVVVEEPGNPKVRQLLNLCKAKIIHQPVDENGMVISRRLDAAQIIFVTPSHQVPTAVTMATQRRQALLKKACKLDQLIVEDDFEHEINFLGQPHPALHSMDTENRVIYISALPKVLAPGLRIGFIVAAPELIRQARRLRQQVIGKPSLLNQRTAALFLSLGHYDSFMSRMHQEMSRRWLALRDALNHYRANFITMPNQGGSVFWVLCPEEINVEVLANEAARRGILIEPDTHYYARSRGSRNCFRMGVTSIPEENIRVGVERLRELMWELGSGEAEYLKDDDPSFLRGEELGTTMRGSTWIYRTVYGDPATFELHADGTMTGRAGHANEEQDEGRWWIEGDLWCRQWNEWAYGESGRYYVSLKGQQLKIFTTGRRLVDSAIIHLYQG
ncbi:MAG: PLP-dependent aminotransferase family protein [Xanthomonadales bacterium]|jgi:GntR family transcriptional regulator/MocR family aminotransferase|nr:PLP-dependent aminotransferase family protein [Xanthomonadales bacterium]